MRGYGHQDLPLNQKTKNDMGLFGKRSWSVYDKEPSMFGRIKELITQNKTKTEPTQANPNPLNWEVRRFNQMGKYLVIELMYPDCTNYEGKKVLVYKNITRDDLYKQGIVDPHFSENKKFHSPIARFEPTSEGWISAKRFAYMMNSHAESEE